MKVPSVTLHNYFQRSRALKSQALAAAIAVVLGGGAGSGFAATTTQTGTAGVGNGNGGAATATAASADLANTAIAQGGNGGNAVTGKGGAGGAATATATSQTSIDNQHIAAISQAVGGDGGNGSPSSNGSGGAGGNATAQATASGFGNGTATIDVWAQGGNGGNSLVGRNYAGGAGGNATITYGSSLPGSGSMAITATMRGGNGGVGLDNGISGSGGNASSSKSMTASTTGAVSLSQHAYGGNAGAVAGNRSIGKAGEANSVVQITANNAASLSLENHAYGGAGASRGPAATFNGGDSGSAKSSTIGVAGSASLVSVTSTANSTAAGISSSPALKGRDGEAVANASAFALAGAATAAATSIGGNSPYATNSAYALAKSATSSTADASLTFTAESGPLAWAKGVAHAASDMGGSATAFINEGSGRIEGTPPRNAVLATIVPGIYNAQSAFGYANSVHRNFDTNKSDSVLGLVTMSAGVETASTDPGIHLFSSSINFSLDMSRLLATPEHLLLGLIDSEVLGGGFQSLHFRVEREGTTIVDKTFASAALAEEYFTDRTLDLGDWTSTLSPDNILDLAFYFDVGQFGTLAGGFSTYFLFGNSTIGSGPVTTVPVPGGFWLFGSALAGLAVRRRLSR